MKKKIFMLAAAVICLSLITGGTLAYFTAEDTARNVITSGKIGVELIEQQREGEELVAYPAQPITVMPNTTVSKIVSAKCTEADSWVRMRYAVSILDANGEEMDITEEELTSLVVIAADSESWLYLDGWWYYKEAVKSGETTQPLFEQVHFSADMDNRFQRCTVYVDVEAEAVQAANNGTAVTEAAGWPET